MNDIVIFESGDRSVEVRLEGETVWLTQRQMAEVFSTTPENVLMHLKNIFSDNELEETATAKEILVVQAEGKRQVKRQLKHYNLDAIISVGYRVNSKRGVRFRQWATRVLRQHLVDGYTLSQQRLQERGIEFEQGFGDELFYPNVASRAAQLLYFLIKNHPLADGNKRTGSFLFLWYLRLNQHLLARPLDRLVNDNTLVALALLVAESAPAQKELMVKLVEHFVLLKENGA